MPVLICFVEDARGWIHAQGVLWRCKGLDNTARQTDVCNYSTTKWTNIACITHPSMFNMTHMIHQWTHRVTNTAHTTSTQHRLLGRSEAFYSIRHGHFRVRWPLQRCSWDIRGYRIWRRVNGWLVTEVSTKRLSPNVGNQPPSDAVWYSRSMDINCANCVFRVHFMDGKWKLNFRFLHQSCGPLLLQ
jgi:hypothetical protein